MLITKDTLVSDVILRLTQGKPSNDLELEKAQVAFILDQVRWKLVSDKVNRAFAMHQQIEPIYIQTEDNIVPTLIPNTGLPVQNNIQIGIQYNPLNVYRDRGIIRVFAIPVQPTIGQPNLMFDIDYGSPVEMITAAELDVIRNLKFSKPSLNNLKFRREGRNLIIYGLDSNTYKMVQFSVTYFPRISILEDLNDNDPVPLTEDLYDPLIEQAVVKCREQMYGSNTDISADATQSLNYPSNPVQLK